MVECYGLVYSVVQIVVWAHRFSCNVWPLINSCISMDLRYALRCRSRLGWGLLLRASSETSLSPLLLLVIWSWRPFSRIRCKVKLTSAFRHFIFIIIFINYESFLIASFLLIWILAIFGIFYFWRLCRLSTNEWDRHRGFYRYPRSSSFFQILELILAASLLKYPVQFNDIMGVQRVNWLQPTNFDLLSRAHSL